MENQRFKNQSGLLTTEKLNKSVLVVGAGAIGSFYAVTIAKMGFTNILVYDEDTVEDHNIANQMYPEIMVGRKKVDALERVVSDYSGVKISKIDKFWHPENAKDAEIVVMATDNMDARIAIWNHYKNKGTTKLIIDGRMGAQVFRAYCVDLSCPDKTFYESTLYPQKDAAPDRCTMKSIIFTVLGVASCMANLTKQWVMEEYRPTAIEYDFVNHKQFTDFIAHKEIGSELESNEEENNPGGIGGNDAAEGSEGGHPLQGSNGPTTESKEKS